MKLGCCRGSLHIIKQSVSAMHIPFGKTYLCPSTEAFALVYEDISIGPNPKCTASWPGSTGCTRNRAKADGVYCTRDGRSWHKRRDKA